MQQNSELLELQILKHLQDGLTIKHDDAGLPDAHDSLLQHLHRVLKEL